MLSTYQYASNRNTTCSVNVSIFYLFDKPNMAASVATKVFGVCLIFAVSGLCLVESIIMR